MKQDADVFCVKNGQKCGLCSLQFRFKVCGGFHMQTTTGEKRASPATFIFNLPTENGLNLRCLHVTSTGKFITGYECSFTFPPNPCNREVEINILQFETLHFPGYSISCVVKPTQVLFCRDKLWCVEIKPISVLFNSAGSIVRHQWKMFLSFFSFSSSFSYKQTQPRDMLLLSFQLYSHCFLRSWLFA